jgi:hypothetical protein
MRQGGQGSHTCMPDSTISLYQLTMPAVGPPLSQSSSVKLGWRSPSIGMLLFVYGADGVVVLPFAVKAMCEKSESGVAPCQCFSSAVICTTSPTMISCSSVSVAIMPVPAVTNST